MKRSSFFVLMLAFACVPTMMFADIREQMDRFEFGLSAGIGFYVSPHTGAINDNISRIQIYDASNIKKECGALFDWTGMETFGGSFGYRFDTRWTLRAQAMHQRLHFMETNNLYLPNPQTGRKSPNRNFSYYNSLCHIDVVAEYNILNLVNVMRPEADMYNVVPYLGFGLGVTLFNKEATLRSMMNSGGNLVESTKFPILGGKNKLTGETSLGASMYLPLIFGVKWRINDQVQLKGTFQYQLYLMNKNLEGGCPVAGEVLENVEIWDKKKNPVSPQTLDATARPAFKDLPTGISHDCLFSLSVIVNMGKWDEDRLITY